jgi:hypothetical protein
MSLTTSNPFQISDDAPNFLILHYLHFVITPSRRMTFGSLNCPITDASNKKSVWFFAV